MKFTPTRIPAVILIEPKVFEDSRGFFFESYRQDKFEQAGIPEIFVQDNVSRSSQGILRGLHYQLSPKAQGKFVRVVSGEVFDVAVDIRLGSATFGEWVGELLSDKNHHMLYVPPGFAHGFYVTSDTAEFEYKCTATYAPELEKSILWNDPQLAISWPLVKGQLPTLSPKDQNAPKFTGLQ